MFDTALQQSSGWQAAHEALTRLARARAGLDFEEGQKLRAAQRARVHERLGYGSFVEYIERLFGYSARLTLEKLRVAEALEGLPHLAQGLRDGNTSWSSVRELTRVATRATERHRLEASRGRTAREVEKLVSGHRPGDSPGGAKDWRAERHVLRFDVSGEVLASFRDAMAKLRRDAGAPRATQMGLGEALDVSTEVAEMAGCDAQRIERGHSGDRGASRISSSAETRLGGKTHVGGEASGELQPPIDSRSERASQTIPPAIRRKVLLRDQHRCQVRRAGARRFRTRDEPPGAGGRRFRAGDDVSEQGTTFPSRGTTFPSRGTTFPSRGTTLPSRGNGRSRAGTRFAGNIGASVQRDVTTPR